ncbi:peptidoglycan editing factor PgeF [Lichenicoccus roseus]|uniref:Purine nucleoside phosphorylase n=1 Tax=Lichenicoccus roseus TaxID=2683649 RepID=A0A5R9IZA8_9PROT|nr:peptidoglycan editing factor PgeF [Lichenicoccus roseus]TLU70810.1 peptidoglycan editing factor PgeF [Lichenicoccus roseus]
MTVDVRRSGLPPFLAGRELDRVRHGFFTRAGGVSQGPYESLNCSMNSGDTPAALAENRARVAAAMGMPPERLLGLTQVHGAECVTVEQPWQPGAGPRADAMATATPGLALGIITADCAPVLLADRDRGVVAAVHAGWRGAAAGVLEATVQAMLQLGARRASIAASVGPCIGVASYEVGEDLHEAVLQAGFEAARFFLPGRRPGHLQFDLPGYCVARLLVSGIEAAGWIGCDTLPDSGRFFSHRRRTLAGGGPIGHQISVIVSGASA